MRQDREDKIDPTMPALVVTYGNTPRKYRPLDRDVFLLGRSPVCDVSLTSPDVAPIHCVLVKGPEGWRLRDCSPKGTTHLNGKQALDVSLQDGDTLQIGSFALRLHLPQMSSVKNHVRVEGGDKPLVAGLSPDLMLSQVQTLQRSRRRLVQLALAYRQSFLESRQQLEQGQLLLQQKDESQRAWRRDFDKRMRELEQVDREMLLQREAFEKERLLWQQEREDIQKELNYHQSEREWAEQDAQQQRDALESERVAWQQERLALHEEIAESLQVDGQARRLNETLEAERAAWQQERSRLQEELVQSRDLRDRAENERVVSPSADQAETARLLHLRSIELAYFARHLQRSRAERRHAAAENTPELMAPSAPEDLAALRQENEKLRQELAEHDGQWAQTHTDGLEKQLARLQMEVTAFKDRETKLLHWAEETRAQAEKVAHGQNEELTGQVALLQTELRERDVVIERLRESLENADIPQEMGQTMELEFIRNRQELERDRQQLNDQLEQMRQRQQDLQDAVRETELQLARERAQLARERVELTRLRDEIQLEQKMILRAERDSGARGRLASIDRLKQELHDKRQAGKT